MECYITSAYKLLTKVQRRNIIDWCNFYQSKYHIAEYRAKSLADKCLA